MYDLIELDYYCSRDPGCCSPECVCEDFCWTAYQVCGYLHAREWLEQYFAVWYAEGEN